jgi:enterobactin synthetase component F
MSLVLPPDLTALQTAIWLEQQIYSGKPIYSTAQFVSIPGPLRFDLFEAALRKTVAESPGLRLPPRPDGVAFDLTLLDFRKEKDPLAAAQVWMQGEMGRAISLDGTALFEFALIRTSEEHTLWFQKFHHIIMDATSRQHLTARTARHYRALRFGEPLPAHDAAKPEELLDAERRYFKSANYAADRAYWLEQFVQWPGPLLDANRQNTERARSGRPARSAFRLKRDDFVRLEKVSRQLGSTPSRVIIALAYAAFARLYARYDIVLGIVLAFRSSEKEKQTIGMMARPVPMLLALDRTTSIADALSQIDEIRARNYPHRHFPVQKLARELDITRKGHHGLFDVIINYIPADYEFGFEDGPIKVRNLSYGFAAPWVVTIAETGPTRDLEVSIDTDPGLISPEMAAQFTSCLEMLLLRGLDDPACPLGSLPILSEQTQAKLKALTTGDAVALPEEATLATLCGAQAKRTPNAVALIAGNQQLTYAELHSRAASLAGRLVALGVKPGKVVGIALPRTPDLVVAVLAVHKAGGAYLALDPAYPAERIRFIVQDAAAPLILTSPELAPIFAESGADLLFVNEASAKDNARAEPSPARAGDLAYVLYTSGSTGQPKAAGIEHRNLVNLICWGRSIVPDAELCGFLFSTSLNFDLSAFEMFLPLAFGGCIILVDNLLALQSAPQLDKVRLINTAPTLLTTLMRTAGLPRGVTTVILAGEKLPRHLAISIFDALPGVRLLNCYGPTETTVYSSWSRVDSKATSEPTIGRPICNTTLYVVDGGGALLPPGIEGELYIGGAGVSRGYLGRPELSAERFLPNPYGSGHMYRTGDRVRWRADGELEFLGRADDQIKINGIRVEPREIETALLAMPEVAAAAVGLHEDAAGEAHLTAYLVPSPGAQISTENVCSALERRLPRNMVPSFFAWLDAMPLTPNGKLDRKALPAPAREKPRAADRRPPEGNLERELAEIWEDVLQVSSIDAHSDFFDLGGDSLALVSLLASIEARFGRRFTVDILSGGLTIAGLAQTLARAENPAEHLEPVVALQPLGNLPPFFCVHGIGGDVLHLHRLAVHMGTARPFYGLRRTAEIPLTDSIERMAARYIVAMRSHQPKGPYYLGGHSFGATVAYEMALQLIAQGQEIGLLAIIDQRKPGWKLTPATALATSPRILANLPRRIREELAQAPAPDRMRHMRRLLRQWLKRVRGIRPDITDILDFKNGEAGQLSSFEANLSALRNYQPTVSRLAPILFRAEGQFLSNLALDATLGWRDLSKGKIRVHTVAGTHGSMATEPFVRQLAKILSRELDVAQGAPEIESPKKQFADDMRARGLVEP